MKNTKLDSKPRNLQDALGCVGAPLYEALTQYADDYGTFEQERLFAALIDAAEKSRELLAALMAEFAQAEVDMALESVCTVAKCHEVDMSDMTVDASTTIEDLVQAGADDLASSLDSFWYPVATPEGWQL